eukprot:8582656-Ditylum_brightwellii.AAC.2
MGIAGIAQKSATSSWPITRIMHTMNTRKDSAIERGKKDLNTTINEKIAEAFSCHKKKEKDAILGTATATSRLAAHPTKNQTLSETTTMGKTREKTRTKTTRNLML